MSYVGYKMDSGETAVTGVGGPREIEVKKLGLDAYFSNSWFKAYSINLFYESERDSNLRAVLTRVYDPEDEGKEGNYSFDLWFHPNADGLNNVNYKNFDDWEIIRKNFCKLVVNPDGTITNPIRCR